MFFEGWIFGISNGIVYFCNLISIKYINEEQADRYFR